MPERVCRCNSCLWYFVSEPFESAILLESMGIAETLSVVDISAVYQTFNLDTLGSNPRRPTKCIYRIISLSPTPVIRVCERYAISALEHLLMLGQY